MGGVGGIGSVCRLIAGGAHGVAGVAGGTGAGGITQQVQRTGSVLFRVQQHPHTQGGIQLLPAGLARKIRHTVVIFRAFLLTALDLPQQGVQRVRPGLLLPVPPQQSAADLIAGSLDLKCRL